MAEEGHVRRGWLGKGMGGEGQPATFKRPDDLNRDDDLSAAWGE